MSWRQTAESLDIQLAYLEKQLHVLRVRRNSITPLYRLPNETLERILLLLQIQPKADTQNDELVDEAETIDPKWSRAMLICRRFRDVALQSGTVWSTITTDLFKESESVSWIDLCIQRAGAHPLNVYGYIRHAKDLATQRLLAAIPNCRRLQLVITPLDMDEKSHDAKPKNRADTYDNAQHDAITYLHQKYLQKPHNRLESLEIVNNLYRSDRQNAISLDERFLGGDNISLRRLRLSKVQIAALPHMPLLEHLDLGRISNDIHCQALRNIVSRAPNLVTLILEHPVDTRQSPQWLFPKDLPDLSREPLVYLPHLKSLCLVGRMLQIPRIMQIFPSPNNQLEFQLEIRDEDEVDYQNVGPYKDYVSIASLQVQHRIAQYLAIICVDKFTLNCTLGLTESSGCDYKYVTLQFQGLSCGGPPPRTLTFRLLCELDNDLSDVLRWVTAIHIRHYEHMFSHITVTEIGQTPYLRCLTATNVHVEAHAPHGGHEATFEKLLSERFQIQGSFIEQVQLRYYDENQDDYELPPTAEVRASVEGRWKSAGWTGTLEWADDCEEEGQYGSSTL